MDVFYFVLGCSMFLYNPVTKPVIEKQIQFGRWCLSTFMTDVYRLGRRMLVSYSVSETDPENLSTATIMLIRIQSYMYNFVIYDLHFIIIAIIISGADLYCSDITK